jgi:DNA invertase Pin-like site-specific DNA recombinase
VVEEYHDAGISGAKVRKDRPGLDRMRKDARRRRFGVVMAWAIDHLGRSVIDLFGAIQALEALRPRFVPRSEVSRHAPEMGDRSLDWTETSEQ